MWHLAQLLPYALESKINGDLRSALREYQTLIKAALQAIIAIQNKDLEKLDSLVGENACEIRAFWLCEIFDREHLDETLLRNTLIDAFTQIEALLQQPAIDALMRSHQSFKTVIEKEKLKIPISDSERILICSFLLSELKSVNIPGKYISTIWRVESAAPKNLQSYGEVSTSFALHLMRKLRKMLAAASVQFVRKKASSLQDPLLMKMISDPFTVIHNALPCIPMFWTYKTLLLIAQKKGIPIILSALFLQKQGEGYCSFDEDKLFYRTESHEIYCQETPSRADLDRPACVIQGVACVEGVCWSKAKWRESMGRWSVMDIILAGAADHRQYPDPELDRICDTVKDGDYRKHKQLALKGGFAANNPSTFFIQHVYAALTGRMFYTHKTRALFNGWDCTSGTGKQQFLSDLLPYDPVVKTGKRLQDGLKEYLLLLTLAEQAIEALCNDEIHRFDPLVGENFCQMRAVKIALILRNPSHTRDAQLILIQKSKNKTLSLLKKGASLFNTELSLKDVLEKEDISIQMSDDESFLISSFILTQTKVVKPFYKKERPLVENAHTNYKKMKEITSVGSSFSCEFIKKLHRQLAAQSVDYIQEIAKLAQVRGESIPLLSDRHVFIHQGLKCLPYYQSTRAVVYHALHQHIPLAMLAQQLAKDQDYQVIQKMQIFFIATPQGYKEVPRSQLDPETLIIVLIGSTCNNLSDLPTFDKWKQKLIEQSPIDLVLAYAAAHRQYPGATHLALDSDLLDHHYEYHKAKAIEWGCSITNPSRFFLTHAFCDKIKNIDGLDFSEV